MLTRGLAVGAAGMVFVGAVAGTSFAARAGASPCDPIGLAMTPQPVLSCISPIPAPSADGAPAPGPVDNVAAPPYVPPVADGNGPPPLSQLGYLMDIWHEFHNGVPADLLYGPAPAPTDAAPLPPEGPVPPPLNP
ncbi:MAG: hypothetical protein WAM92_01995 [Mycobacterium sp.]